MKIEKRVTANDESTFWEPVFREIFDIKNYHPGEEVFVHVDDGRAAIFQMEEDGIRQLENGIYLKKSCYPVKKLRKIDPETGQHLFYDIIPNNMGTMTMDVGARYGNTGGTNAGADLIEGAFVGKPFPSHLYWAKYFNLIRKGYKDYTDDVYDAEEEIRELEKLFAPEDAPVSDENETVLRVSAFLANAAKELLSSQIDVDWMSSKPPFSRKQVQSARKVWNAFRAVRTVKNANDIILNLLAITDVSFKDGKYKKKVTDFLVKETGDRKKDIEAIASRIDQWDAIIMAMEATLAPASGGKDKKKVVSPFGNVEMEMASDEEMNRIRKKFGISGYKTKLVKVTAPDFEKRYLDYMKENNISVEKEFLHGSRTSNWTSIITNGLLLNPDAPITGKAFGNGIYTARDFEKSLGYTGYRGSKWAGGTSAVGVIGVYRCAYGDPLYAIPNQYGIFYDTEIVRSKKNCLDAKKEVTGYRMDEIIFFREEALSLEYLLFFADADKELDWLY